MDLLILKRPQKSTSVKLWKDYRKRKMTSGIAERRLEWTELVAASTAKTSRKTTPDQS